MLACEVTVVVNTTVEPINALGPLEVIDVFVPVT
jgi:hypothetical protein